MLLLAAKFGVPVCPHAGGVGLCEMVQHVSVLDYVAVSGSLDGRVTEYVDHLHEHFTDPCLVRDTGSGPGYVVPSQPGYSTQMHPASVARFRYPDGSDRAGRRASEATAAPVGNTRGMSRTDEVVEAIKEMILDGRLQAGARLPVEKDLADAPASRADRCARAFVPW